MHFAPRNACEQQYFNRAMGDIRLMMSQHPMWAKLMARYNGNIPQWMESAIKQHALFYAAEMCQGRG